jgi:predicted alpha/beta superfamily hydrolase
MLLTELLPFLQTQYRIDSVNLGVGGVGVGAIAAAHAALKNPAVFSHLIMVSPPLGKGIAQDQLLKYIERFRMAAALPRRIFQSVGRYETRSRFFLPAQALHSALSQREDVAYKYVEIGSGHGLVGFRSIAPEALSWVFPGESG